LNARRTHPNSFHRSVPDDCFDPLKIREKAAFGDPCNFETHAALFFGQTPTTDGISRNWFFSASVTGLHIEIGIIMKIGKLASD